MSENSSLEQYLRESFVEHIERYHGNLSLESLGNAVAETSLAGSSASSDANEERLGAAKLLVLCSLVLAADCEAGCGGDRRFHYN